MTTHTPAFALSLSILLLIGCTGDAFEETAQLVGSQGGEAAGAGGSFAGEAGASGSQSSGGTGAGATAGAGGASGSPQAGSSGTGSTQAGGTGGTNTTTIACGPDYTCTFKTATSKATGLTWQRYGEGLGTWVQAAILCSDLGTTPGFGGGQWRLPTAEEAASIWKIAPSFPYVDTEPFPNKEVLAIWLIDIGDLPASHNIGSYTKSTFMTYHSYDTQQSRVRCVKTQ